MVMLFYENELSLLDSLCTILFRRCIHTIQKKVVKLDTSSYANILQLIFGSLLNNWRNYLIIFFVVDLFEIPLLESLSVDSRYLRIYQPVANLVIVNHAYVLVSKSFFRISIKFILPKPIFCSSRIQNTTNNFS